MPNTVEYKDWLFVTVPKEATQFEYTDKDNWPRIQYFKHYVQEGHIDVPAGSWQIIGKGDAIDWEGIVERTINHGGTTKYYLYKDYISELFKFSTTTESGHSLLRSLEMEPGTVLILKKL